MKLKTIAKWSCFFLLTFAVMFLLYQYGTYKRGYPAIGGEILLIVIPILAMTAKFDMRRNERRSTYLHPIMAGGALCQKDMIKEENSKLKASKSDPTIQDELSEIELQLSDIIEESVALAGYKVFDARFGYLIARHGVSDTDFKITIEKLVH